MAEQPDLFPPQSETGIDDVVVVGDGIGALACALSLAPRPVTLVTRKPLAEIADRTIADEVAVGPGEVAALADEALAAGQGLAEPGVLQMLAGRGPQCLTFWCDGDKPADEATLVRRLAVLAGETAGIRRFERCVPEQISMKDREAAGVIAVVGGEPARRILLPARAVVLADEGAAGSFGSFTGMAARAGAVIADAEFVRFDTGRWAGPGGIFTDALGRTTLDGLWACGDCASTGAQGAAYRPALALIETLVFAAAAAEDIADQLPIPQVQPWRERPAAVAETAVGELQGLEDAVRGELGGARSAEGLDRLLAHVGAAESEPVGELFANALAAARLAAVAARAREESRGLHRRADFTETDPALGRRSFLTLAQVDEMAGEMAAG